MSEQVKKAKPIKITGHKQLAEVIATFKRAMMGMLPEGEQAIDILIDKKNPTERTRLVNYPFVAKNEALRLGAQFYEELKPFDELRKAEEIAFIPYRGDNREEYIKGLQKQPEQAPFIIQGMPQAPPKREKRSFLDRFKGKKKDEFGSEVKE